MKCVSCGQELVDGVKFCKYCGARQIVDEPVPAPSETVVQPVPVPAPSDTASVPPVTQEISQVEPVQVEPAQFEPVPVVDMGVPVGQPPIAPSEPPKKKKSKLWMAIVGILAVLAVAGGVAYHVAETKRAEALAQAYAQAQELYAGGSYQAAVEAFTELEDYEDSAAMAERANLWLAAQAAEEKAGEDPAAWDAAAQAYDLIHEGAAQEAAQNCRDNSAYFTAADLMAAGSWSEASEAFAPLAESSFKDAADLQLECDTHVTADKAEALLAEGSNYEAYKLFLTLVGRSYEGLPDFGERAAACVVDFPSTGVVYSNPDYSSTAVPLTIKEGGSYVYYKIYSGDDLVRTVFISPNSSATVNLPAGTYRMNEAHGELWFGEDDMFGDDGVYYRCSFGGSETFELRSGYSYEISSSGEGTGIGTSATDRESF